MPIRGLALLAVLLATLLVATAPRAQSPPAKDSAIASAAPTTPGRAPSIGDLELVEKLLSTRREYQKTLEQLRLYYLRAGELELARQTEEELRQYHRMQKFAYRLDLIVPPPGLSGNTNVPEANKLYTWAMSYKDRGWKDEYIDNQRRAELLFQDLLTKYPHSDKISDTAFQLGDLYESKAYKQYRLSAEFYVRCYQWNPKTHFDARIRAARIYDRTLHDRGKAIGLYREVITHETDSKRLQEANTRLQELSSTR